MNIFSSEAKNSCSISSPRLICNSLRSSPIVLSVEWRSTSLMVRNCGLLSSMTQQLGDMFTSQSEKAYRASRVLSDDTPGARCTCISTSADVMSSTFFTFIFPFSTAFSIDSFSVSAVLPNGISLMTSVLLSSFSIFALTLRTPPRCPSL